MKFLADENVEKPIVDMLRALRHEVLYVSELASGLDDDVLLEHANRQGRILITNDKDFGELVYLQGRNAIGVVLMRFSTEKATLKAAFVKALLKEYGTQLARHFAVINEAGVRLRPLR